MYLYPHVEFMRIEFRSPVLLLNGNMISHFAAEEESGQEKIRRQSSKEKDRREEQIESKGWKEPRRKKTKTRHKKIKTGHKFSKPKADAL